MEIYWIGLDWRSAFSDLFRSTIHHNQELTHSQRLQYLKASVKGDAAAILRTTKITDANYLTAWQTLEDRYNVKSALVHAQIHALFTQPKANNSDGIKKLYDITIDCLNSLANMTIVTTNWDPILIYLIQERLPVQTLALWNQLRFGKTDIPTWKEMKTFLQSCCLTTDIEAPKQFPPANSHPIAPRPDRTNHRPHFQRSQSSPGGLMQQLRALIDNGSQSSFIT